MIQYKFGERINASPASADAVSYDNSISGMEATTVQGAVDHLNNSLGQKVTKFSSDNYVPVDALAYDEANKKLGLKVAGADTVIPFSSGYKFAYLTTSNVAQNASAKPFFVANKNYKKLFVKISDTRFSSVSHVYKNGIEFVPEIVFPFSDTGYFYIENVEKGDVFSTNGSGGGGVTTCVYDGIDSLEEIMNKVMTGSGSQTITVGTFAKDYDEIIIFYNDSSALTDETRFVWKINDTNIPICRICKNLGSNYIKIYGIKANDVLSFTSANAVTSGKIMYVYEEK